MSSEIEPKNLPRTVIPTEPPMAVCRIRLAGIVENVVQIDVVGVERGRGIKRDRVTLRIKLGDSEPSEVTLRPNLDHYRGNLQVVSDSLDWGIEPVGL